MRVFLFLLLYLLSLSSSLAVVTGTFLDNANNETGFLVERSPNAIGTNYTPLLTLPANVTIFTDANIRVGEEWWYRVRAFNAYGMSEASAAACVDVVSGLPPLFMLPPIVSGTIALTTTSDPLTQVWYQINGITIGTATTVPTFGWDFNTTSYPDGSYLMNIVAQSASGATYISPPVPIMIRNIFPLTMGYGLNEGTGAVVADASGHGLTGTLSGTTWTTAGKYGNALAFASAGKITSGLTTHATIRNYVLWTYRSGAGGGNYGRIFDKRVNGSEVEVLYNDEAANVYRYIRQWSGGLGSWSIARPSASTWHHLVVTYDASQTGPPTIYVDGLLVTVTTVSVPSGIPVTDTDGYVFGNRGTGDRGWNGMLDDIRIYDDLKLSPAQIQNIMEVGLQ